MLLVERGPGDTGDANECTEISEGGGESEVYAFGKIGNVKGGRWLKGHTSNLKLSNPPAEENAVSKRPTTTPDETPAEETVKRPASYTPKKGRPTPTRAEQEAARKRPLADNSKEAKQRRKEEMREARMAANAGYQRGDEKYLPPRDKGPQRRWVRDFVDSKRRVEATMMYAAIPVLIGTYTGIPRVQEISMLVFFALAAATILSAILLSNRVKKLARAKWGDETQKGLGLYAALRAIQPRRLRAPRPQIAIGAEVQ